MNDEVEALDIVARAVDRITQKGRFAELKLTNGILLGLKPVPPLLIEAVNNEFKLPEPPTVYLDEKGRDEPNPNDPEYQKELKRLEEVQNLAITDLILGVGTRAISVPEGYFMPEDDGWVASVEFANQLSGVTLKVDAEPGIRRYLQWLRFYAIESSTDLALVTGLPLRLAGIREGEIEEVVDSFQRLPERGTDNVGSITPGSQNGHTANRAARRSSSANRGT